MECHMDMQPGDPMSCGTTCGQRVLSSLYNSLLVLLRVLIAGELTLLRLFLV